MSELKPCPLFGCEVHLTELRWHGKAARWILIHSDHPVCPLSEAPMKAYKTKKDALFAWNTREVKDAKD